MNNVLARSEARVCSLIFSGQHQEGQGALVEHFFENISNIVTRARSGLECDNVIFVLLSQMVSQLFPVGTVAVSDEDSQFPLVFMLKFQCEITDNGR
jgi:hypothetical protein